MKTTKRFFLLIALGLSSVVASAQVKTEVKEFRVSGPFPIGKEVQVGDLSVAHTDGGVSTALPAMDDSRSVSVLEFEMQSASFAKGKINIDGVEAYKLWVDGKESTGALNLNPYPHQVKIMCVSKPASEQKEEFSISLDMDVEMRVSVDEKRDITIYDILSGTRVSGASLSSDGKYIIESFTTTQGNVTSRSTVLKEVASGREITRFEAGVSPVWMPTTPAYMVKQGSALYKVDPQTQERTLLVENMPGGSFTMSPTEDYMIITNRKDGPKEKDADVYEILEPDDRQPGWRNRMYLSKLDLASGVNQKFTFSDYSNYLMDISADGSKLLVASSRSRLEKRPTSVISLYVIDSKTLVADTVMKDVEFVEAAKFSPDATELVLRASPEAFDGIGEHIKPDQTSSMIHQVLYKYNIASGKVTPLTDKITQSVISFEWSEADGQIYFSAEDRDYERIYSLNPRNNKLKSLECKEDMSTFSSMASKAPVIAYLGESASNSKRLYVLDVAKGEHKLMEDSSAEILKDVELGQVKDWNYRNSRGETIYGRYYLPPHFDPAKKYPMIVNYYGGCSPTGRTFESRYPHHVYAAMGYVVYVVQPSGATGFGQEFAARHVNSYGQYTADDIIEGTKRFCQEHSFVDAEKIGCIGASFGGFMTQYLLTVTDIFAAGISHAGISDISSYWGEGYWGYSYSEVSWANSYPWNAGKMVIEQSPLFNADKIHTPLLFLHGMSDTNVPPGESIQMFTALKLLGRETAFVGVKDQDHHITQYDKRLRWQETIFAWFAKHLKEDSSWWDAMYPEKNL